MKKNSKINTKFLDEISRCNVQTFLGVVKLLSVKMIDEDKKPRDFSDMLADVMDKYSKKSQSFKKELLTILKEANKGVKADASGTENSEEAKS